MLKSLPRRSSTAARAGRQSAAAGTVACALIFAALGDETRLKLLARLSEAGPQSIAALAGGFDISRQAITKHLRVMEDAGLVRRTQQGRESLWQVEQTRLAEARRHLDSISAHWDEALGRLKRFVERVEQ